MSAEPALPVSLDEANQRYESLKSHFKEGLQRKRQADQELTDIESQIYLYEGSYLNTTSLSGGNVIRGFDTYLKASAGSAGGARAPSVANSPDDRMFSTSSATFQRSLALKINENADSELARSEDTKNSMPSSQSSGYKLKRKVDDISKKA